MAEMTFERILKWKLLPRLMMFSVMVMTYQTTSWMMTLPDPTITQSGFCSIVFGCFSATFAVWLNHEK